MSLKKVLNGLFFKYLFFSNPFFSYSRDLNYVYSTHTLIAFCKSLMPFFIYKILGAVPMTLAYHVAPVQFLAASISI